MSTALVLSALGAAVAVTAISLHFLLVLFTPHPTAGTASETTFTTIPGSSASPLPRLTDPPSKRISVIIPAYNEDDRLGIMLDEVVEYFQDNPKPTNGLDRRKGGVEVLVVDDGSNDSTTLTAQKLAGKWGEKATEVEIRVITLKRNRGKGGAVQHGVLHSRGELILFADADGATRFADLDDLLVAMDKVQDDGGHGMVVGSRAHLVKSEAVVKRSVLRNLLMHGFHLFLRTLGVGGIRDTQCGFKLFTRETARLLFPSLHLHRWSFDVELLLLGSLSIPAVPVREVPVAWHEVSGSKISLGWDSIGMARDLLVLRGNLLTGRWTVPQRSPPNQAEANEKVVEKVDR